MTSKVLYEPRGRAGEYSPLAANLYAGCEHGCVYCYAPNVTYKTRETFLCAKPRPGVIEALQADVRRWDREKLLTLLCFTCDPYQPIEADCRLTREAIRILHEGGFPVTILTKAGNLAQRDFDLLGPRDAFAASLTFMRDEDSLMWEPRAALPAERLANLERAHALGIRTWASLEPVIDPAQTFGLIRESAGFVDLFKVGKLNHHPAEKLVDWKEFVREVVGLFESLGCAYYLKEDLRVYLKPRATSRR